MTSFTLPPLFLSAASTHLGVRPRPLQVCDGLSGLRYLGLALARLPAPGPVFAPVNSATLIPYFAASTLSSFEALAPLFLHLLAALSFRLDFSQQ